MKKRLHLGIGHYGIGFQDGVNMVISRNVKALLKICPDLKITLFGKLAKDYREFITPKPASLEYREIKEFDPQEAVKQFGGKPISEQQVHDYMWQGTNIAETLIEKLSDMDVVIAENLGIGIHPAVTYAFYLYTQYSFAARENKKFIYRFHDFVQQRPENFRNVKKFHYSRFGIVPDWHSILYPAFSNIKYIVINRYDWWRLIEHGIEEKNIYYIPHSVDESIIPPDNRSEELRKKIIEREKLSPSVKFIFYPVRCVRRKNVEEAIFLTKFFNSLSKVKLPNSPRLKEKFHLIVSVKPKEGEDARYAQKLIEFVKRYNLPATIGIEELVSWERKYDPQDKNKIIKYGIGDAYRIAELVITTSILEGFGFVYIEPWILERAVIGRNIPAITPDFQAAGMKLGHLYTALLVEGRDFKDIGKEKKDPDEALEERLSRILKLDDPAYVERFIESNETSILATLKLFDEKRRKKLVQRNKEVVKRVYSQEVIGKKIYEVITA